MQTESTDWRVLHMGCRVIFNDDTEVPKVMAELDRARDRMLARFPNYEITDERDIWHTPTDLQREYDLTLREDCA